MIIITRWCVYGDFNSVQNGGERCGRGGGVVDAEADKFNEFILNSELIDLPLHGRRFTWSRSDGSSMSRLDRFPLSGSWCTTWPNCVQVAILRGLSDHFPLILREQEEDWGPRPFRMMKCWRDFPDYNNFVRDQLGSYFIDGWGDFVLNQFKSQRISRSDIGNLDFKTISESEANVLVAEFGEDEIKQALWDCDSFKSSGPDGALAKVLANRLIKVIGSVISVKQSTFVKGRQILDECVRSASASVLVNGSPTDEFTFERGLRQGDPLSPFLFLIAAEGLNAMVNVSVHANLFSGFSVGEDVPFRITHLQFADDTLMVVDKNWANIQEAAGVLYCKTGKTPLPILACLLGVILEDYRFGNRLLIKSNLACQTGSVAPACIVSIIESLFKSFLWGGDGEAGKIYWIHWDKVCLERSQGGLGVRKVKEFNVALLGKWCWRLRTERDEFWRQVLVRKYGESRGVIGEGGRKASGWWKDINSIKNGSFNGFDHWFDNFIFKQAGNKEDSLFWDDPWLEEGVSLRDRFPRLACLFTDQGVSVGEMCRRGWDIGGGGWSWRRPLFVWEEELLARCCGLFHNVVLQPNELDRWHWRSLHSDVFMVKGAYQTLTRAEEEAEPMLNSTALVWNKVVPVKVSLFA
ncbi:hypothetical protein TSUD_141640 [Trifolium subterraneum]|uniref:Uncharacterized protein n=1 Tax=Trifolium subterraneum TaxID=3900 RepID=A0A2Z6P070_TRISU|nr:hypothetical protein TSUD_141640 [Trifolium subterraneum]